MRFYVRSHLSSEVLDQSIRSYCYVMVIYKHFFSLSVSTQSFLTMKVSVWSSAEKTRTARQERNASAMAVATCAHQPRKQVRLSPLPKLLGLKGQCTWSCPTFQQMFNSNLS